MNFELTPQQKAVQQSARQFAQTVLQETVLEDDAAGRFPEEAYKKMGEMGFVSSIFEHPVIHKRQMPHSK